MGMVRIGEAMQLREPEHALLAGSEAVGDIGCSSSRAAQSSEEIQRGQRSCSPREG
jgi:hypothetical protein